SLVLVGKVKGIGVISYIDYQTDKMEHNQPFYSRFMHKRKAFEFESELRAVALNADETAPENGQMVSVDLNSLVESVVLAPGSEKTLENAVRALTTSHGLIASIRRSSLEDVPKF